MENALWEECSIWEELFFFLQVFFPPLVTRVLLSCYRSAVSELLCCSVAEMLDLDFTPGVLITDGVSLATYAGGEKKTGFYVWGICFCASRVWTFESCIIIILFYCHDVHDVQFTDAQMFSVRSTHTLQCYWIRIWGTSCFFHQFNQFFLPPEWPQDVNTVAFIHMPWKKSCQNTVWHHIADLNIKQTNKHLSFSHTSLECILYSPSHTRQISPRSTALGVGAYLFLNVSSNVLVTCHLGRKCS